MPVTISGSGLITTANASFSGTLSSASRGISSSSVPAGSIIQVVNAVYTTQWSATPGQQVTPNGNMADTGFGITITPTSATSKIMLMGQLAAMNSTGGGATDFIFKRGATILQVGVSGANDNYLTGFYLNAGTDKPWVTLPFFVLDSPNTTSSTTYQLFGLGGNGNTLYLNRRSDSWSAGATIFFAMELAQ